ncbi:GGDEF domain-containing protein [Paraburkholderia graminis]|uniref:GGDEF domain-containing protein n=1 Tax=Paraburkholderia graminis TaxID=60548 RepID=UPI0038B70605
MTLPLWHIDVVIGWGRPSHCLRTVLESSRFDEIEATLRVTTSAGIARYRPGEDLRALLARADQLLYAAKRAGRNRVVGESPGQTRDAPERNMV